MIQPPKISKQHSNHLTHRGRLKQDEVPIDAQGMLEILSNQEQLVPYNQRQGFVFGYSYNPVNQLGE